MDTALDEGQMKVGRKLGTKLLNASKFVLSFGEPPAGTVPTAAFDLAMLARLRSVVTDATSAFESFDYTRALEATEEFFWWFCDDYVELVKSRAYALDRPEAAASAQASLRQALHTVLRLFAPFIPFVTEEVWSWWQEGSIHSQSWPSLDASPAETTGDADILDPVGEVLALIRRTKTEAKVSQKAAVSLLVVTAPAATHALVAAAESDLRDAGSIETVRYQLGDALTCTVELAPVTETA